MAAACDYEDHDGKVVDKIYEKESDTYMNIGMECLYPYLEALIIM